MDVSAVVAQHQAAQAANYKSITVEKDIPLEADLGLLTISDPNPIDNESYSTNREAHLQSLARDGVQHLLAQIFALPTQKSIYGPLAVLPKPTTHLPRSKPLPKPNQLTRWQKFANAKGIQHVKKVNKVWDEEKQEFRARWGRGGKNKDLEDQWLHEIPTGKPDNWDAAAEARQARKERLQKNTTAHLKNKAYSARVSGGDKEARKAEIDRTVLRARTSTASMGKFDKQLEGEKKIRGVKRKFAPNESLNSERDASMAMITKLGGKPPPSKKQKAAAPKPTRLDQTRADDVINVRKAVKNASRGGGSMALAKSTEKVKFQRTSKTSRKKMRGVRK